MKETSESERRTARDSFEVTERGERNVPGAYTVENTRRRMAHRVIYHGEGNPWNSCDCGDFRIGATGTCRHIDAVAQWLKAHRRKADARMPANSALDVCYTLTPPRVRLRVGSVNSDEITALAMRYFDDDNIAVDGMLAELPAFVDRARRLDPRFFCTGDALNMILGERDRLRRNALADTLTVSRKVEGLPPGVEDYKLGAMDFAFRAGRAIIADEPGLDKCREALYATHLLESFGMVSSVLVVCPTSLREHWRKEIEEVFHEDATMVEGEAPERRKLYGRRRGFSIVSYHTLANDIKALGSLSADMLILDKADRLSSWNAQITQAARRVDAEYLLALSDVCLDERPEQLYELMQFVDPYVLGPRERIMSAPPRDLGALLRPHMLRRTRQNVEGQRFLGHSHRLYIALTAEQRAIHDSARDEAMELAEKWTRFGFLTEKNRRRLLLAVKRMLMACDSTYLADGHSNSGTKVAEAVETVRAAVADGHTKVAVFCRWERMARLMAEALTAAGIGFCQLSGGMPGFRRGELRRRFASDTATKVFLGTYSASAGLDLPEASLVLNLDMPWEGNIGKDIHSINFTGVDSIEERSLISGIAGDYPDTFTLDDSSLTRLAESLREIFAGE